MNKVFPDSNDIKSPITGEFIFCYKNQISIAGVFIAFIFGRQELAN